VVSNMISDMLRSLLFLLFVVHNVDAVIPVMSLTRRPYTLPCNICTNALLNEMESPSQFPSQFAKKAPAACDEATKNTYERYVCVTLLKKNARAFVRAQRRGEAVRDSCANTRVTNCVLEENRFTILCDKKRKNGQCHVITINE
jgi:hypothetical protein